MVANRLSGDLGAPGPRRARPHPSRHGGGERADDPRRHQAQRPSGEDPRRLRVTTANSDKADID
jgi:hypothetical protein